MRFRTTIELHGRTATGLRVPDDVVAALGGGRRPPVRVTIGGHTYRSTVAPYAEASMLPLSAANREAAGVAAGDEVEVDLEPDTEERTIDVPADLADALAAAGVRAAFDALSFSNRRQRVELVTGAKQAATRARRVEKVVAGLAATVDVRNEPLT